MQDKFNDYRTFFSIGDVAKMFNVNTSLIRFWEKEFSIINPKKNKNGVRIFTRKDIESIDLVYNLVKIQKMTLEGARKKILSERKNSFNKFDVIQTLQNIKDELIKINDTLK